MNTLKRISIVFIAVILMFSAATTVFAETIQDRLEKQMADLVDRFQNADPETQQSIQERFNSFLKENGLDEIDLGNLADTDIAGIIGNLGNNLAMEDFLGLAQEAFGSGFDMIKDVFSGGLGTSNGSNTITPNTNQTQPTNVIVAVPNYTPSSTSQAPTTEPTTYDVGETTAAAIVGAGVTASQAVTVTGAIVAEDSGMSKSSVIVLVVLSVATILVIVAIIIFFIMKKK